MKTSLGQRWLRFNAAGLLGIGVQLAVLSLLARNGAGYLSATFIAVECAILHNFLWHEHWTWRHATAATPEGWPLRLLKFHVANGLIAIAGNALLMSWFVGVLGGPVVISNLITIVLCGTANFIAGDRFVFRSRALGQPHEVAAHPKTD